MLNEPVNTHLRSLEVMWNGKLVDLFKYDREHSLIELFGMVWQYFVWNTILV